MNTDSHRSDEEQPVGNTVLNDFAAMRSKAVQDGLESKELAALLIEKFAEGMTAAAGVSVIEEADQLCSSIDPGYRNNRTLRYARVAKLDLTTPRDRQ